VPLSAAIWHRLSPALLYGPIPADCCRRRGIGHLWLTRAVIRGLSISERGQRLLVYLN